MMNNYLRLFIVACFVFVAGYSNAQFKFGDKSNVGQTVTTDAQTGISQLMVTFNTDKGNSTWTQDSTSISISFSKAQTNKGIKQEVFDGDSANAAKIFNGDFKVRNWGAYENLVHMASIDSMAAIFTKCEEKYAGTADSTKNVLWQPSACLFDVAGDDANQVYGTHPGMYKRVEYGFYFSFSGFALSSDIEFEMSTYDEGNTGQTASYDLVVAIGSETNVVDTVTGFYVSGSGTKSVKLAEAIGMDMSDFDNTKVYFWLKTLGTGTAMAKDSFDPTVVFDNISVSYQNPFWVTPAAGIAGNSIMNNANSAVVGNVGEETTAHIALKTKGRLSSLTITNDLLDNTEMLLTFPDTLGLMANDGSGNYTVEVPYTFTPGTYDPGTMTYSKAKIEVAAPASGSVNDDMMLAVTFTPESPLNKKARIELSNGTRIWYDLYFRGAGSIVDLTGVEDGYILKDTLGGVADGSQILLAPGKMYMIGGYAFDKSLEFQSSDPEAADMPIVDCSSPGDGYGSNFDMVADSSVDYIIFRNLKFTGSFGDHYVMNISKQSAIGDLVFEGCKVHSLRGVVRIKDNPSTVENFTVDNCVMDSVNNYGLLTMDKAGGYVNNISITNSTFSKFVYFIVNRNNSTSLTIDMCTLSEVPEKGRQLIRYREGDGKNDVTDGLKITNTLIGHGWNLAGETDFAIKGKEGLTATTVTVTNVLATNDFAYSSDTIVGLPSSVVDKSASELWVNMNAVNFNYLDETFEGIGNAGDPRWMYEDTTIYVLYAGAGAPDAIEISDSLLVDYLMNAGYNVKYVDDNDIGVAGYDYSHYQALVVGESTSSSRVVPFGKDDHYPIPLVSIEGFGVKSDKWGWLTDNANFQESRTAVQNMDMKILDNSHYITQDYAVDQVVSLSTAAASGDIYAWGLGLATDVPGAIALGQNTNVDITAPMLWAVPKGTTLGATGQLNDHRMVIFAANAKGLNDATNDFNQLVERSLEWVLGAGTTVGVPQSMIEDQVMVYPNPAINQARVRFTLSKSATVSLSLYNMMGQQIRITTSETFFEGTNEIQMNTSSLVKGMYFYVLQIGDEAHKGKLNVIK